MNLNHFLEFNLFYNKVVSNKITTRRWQLKPPNKVYYAFCMLSNKQNRLSCSL